MNQSIIFKKILRRNFSEVVLAYNSYIAWIKMWEGDPRIYPSEFLGQCSHALRITMLSHCIKVLERDSTLRSKSFWYIFKHREIRINSILQDNNSNIRFLKKMAKKFSIIRNKTLFHLDDESINDPESVWSNADIKLPELEKIIKLLLTIFETLYSDEVSTLYPFVKYSGGDARLAVEKIRRTD